LRIRLHPLQELLQMKVRIELDKVNLMQLRRKVIFQIAVNETKGMGCSNYIDTICPQINILKREVP
jgi:hypothetical protein